MVHSLIPTLPKSWKESKHLRNGVQNPSSSATHVQRDKSTKESQQWNKALEKRVLTTLEREVPLSEESSDSCPSVVEQAAVLTHRLWRCSPVPLKSRWCQGTNTAAPAAAWGRRVCVTLHRPEQTVQWTQEN